jgi:hypothetical protein
MPLEFLPLDASHDWSELAEAYQPLQSMQYDLIPPILGSAYESALEDHGGWL